MVDYPELGGRLIEMTASTCGVRQLRWGRRGGLLELGDHVVANELRALDIAPEPLLTLRTIGERFAMPGGRPVGIARSYVGYIGEKRDVGRYVVHYTGRFLPWIGRLRS